MAATASVSLFEKQHGLCKDPVNQFSVLGTIWRPVGSRSTAQYPAAKSTVISLKQELGTPALDEMYEYLWLVTQREGDNIDPLHRQLIKSRKLVIAEDTRLHMLWYHSKIFLKPPPTYLFHHGFWEDVVMPDPGIQALVTGFLRSWSYLVQFPSDLRIAKEHGFLDNHITWDDWCNFIAPFRALKDSEVARRYHFGQIRLLRLTLLYLFLRPASGSSRWVYERLWSIQSALQRSLTPFLFIFASLSLILSAMQVLVSISPEDVNLAGFTSSDAITLRSACWVFSVFVLLLSIMIWSPFVLGLIGALTKQILWGYRRMQAMRSPEAKVLQGVRHQV